MLDFKGLLEPYRLEPNGVERTVEMQVKWMLAKNIPRHHIDQALLTVYGELAEGRAFAHQVDESGAIVKSSGHMLDHELLRVAQNLQKAELEESVNKLQESFNGLAARHAEVSISEAMEKMNRHLNWLQRVAKKVFRI